MSKACKFLSVLFVVIGVLGGIILAVSTRSFLSFLIPLFSGAVSGILFASIAEILDQQDQIVELTGMIRRQLERMEKENHNAKS